METVEERKSDALGGSYTVREGNGYFAFGGDRNKCSDSIELPIFPDGMNKVWGTNELSVTCIH